MTDAIPTFVARCLLRVLIVAGLAAQTAGAADGDLASQARSHWAFQPLEQPTIPNAAGDSDHAGDAADNSNIDALLAARRSAAGVAPLGRADSRTLVRRIYVHLTGLPPTPSEVREFLADKSGAAVEHLVDDLLSRPEFGERWGRHWLDVARYADSNGCSVEANNTFDNAWRYRDYVIAALNNDKPFDRFVLEQIAGDLLDATADYQRAEQIIATGFLVLGPKAFGTGNVEKVRLDAIDDQIDTVGKAFLGLSLGCARCHDHKLEPVAAEDYYALAGIFGSTETIHREEGWRCRLTWHRTPLPVLDRQAQTALREQHAQRLEAAKSGELVKQVDAELAAAKAEVAKLAADDQTTEQQQHAARRRLEQAELAKRNASRMAKVLPVVAPFPVAMAVVDSDQPRDEPVRLGGDPEVKEAAPPRAVLPVPATAGREKYQIGEGQSGRLQLAKWLVDVDHGAGRMTARVLANRVWGHLMGTALVPTVDNFGLTGLPPTHPELLDHLAVSLVDNDWSIKRLIRRIVLSDAYQLASGDSPSALETDPENRLIWRRTPRRLDVEALRDSALAISGELDRTRGGKTLQQLGLVTLHSDYIDLDTPSPYRRRSVYLPLIRDAVGLSPETDATAAMRTAFDAASPNLVCGARTTSIVPAQALFLMNSQFLDEQASAAARRLLDDSRWTTHRQRIDRLFELTLARPADDDEADAALQLMEALQADAEEGDPADADLEVAVWSGLCQALFASNEFLFLR